MFYLRDPRAEGDEVLDMFPTFARKKPGSNCAGGSVMNYERAEAALKAREAIADRTFTSNAKRLLKLLED